MDGAEVASHVPSAEGAPKVRHYELDWLRVMAFGLLVPLHVAAAFLPEGHAALRHDQLAGDGLVLARRWIYQWRMPLLFLTSGVGSYYALRHRTAATYTRERMRRIVIPAIATMLLLLPIHTYLLRNAADGVTLVPFLRDWYGGLVMWPVEAWSRPSELWVKTQHLWFLVNLFLYSMVLALFWWWRPTPLRPWADHMSRLLSSREWFGLLLLALPLMAVELAVKPWAQGYLGIGFLLPWYFVFFLYGFLLANTGDVFWKVVRRHSWSMFGLAVGASFALQASYDWAGAAFARYDEALRVGGWHNVGWPRYDRYSIVVTAIRSLHAWVWVLAIFGLAGRFLSRPSRVLGYVNLAVAPFYLVHQTVLILLLLATRDLGGWWVLKFAAICVLTYAGSLLFFEGARRFRITRLFFSIKESPRPAVEVPSESDLAQR